MLMTTTPLSPAFIEADAVLESLYIAARDPYNRFSIPEAMDRLKAVYNSATEIVRYKIVTDLTEIKSTTPVPFLVEVLRNDESAMVRHEAAFGIGALGRENDSVHLIDSLKNDPSNIVRHEAAIALAEIGGSDAIPALEAASKHSDPDVAMSAQFAVQNIRLYLQRFGKVANG